MLIIECKKYLLMKKNKKNSLTRVLVVQKKKKKAQVSQSIMHPGNFIYTIYAYNIEKWEISITFQCCW